MMKKNKTIGAFIGLIFGLSLIFYGLTGITIEKNMEENIISDEEVIERARDLGMVELTEKIMGNGE